MNTKEQVEAKAKKLERIARAIAVVGAALGMAMFVVTWQVSASDAEAIGTWRASIVEFDNTWEAKERDCVNDSGCDLAKFDRERAWALDEWGRTHKWPGVGKQWGAIAATLAIVIGTYAANLWLRGNAGTLRNEQLQRDLDAVDKKYSERIGNVTVPLGKGPA